MKIICRNKNDSGQVKNNYMGNMFEMLLNQPLIALINDL